jgi:alpha/beta superfamily hydrolase
MVSLPTGGADEAPCALPTSPHPRRRRKNDLVRCATLTIQLVQKIGQATVLTGFRRQTTCALVIVLDAGLLMR